MKNFYTFLIILLPLFSFAQAHFNADGGFDWSVNNGQNLTLRAGAGKYVTEKAYTGFSMGVTRLNNYPKLMFPVAVKLMYSLVSSDYIDENVFHPVLILEPGWNIYREKVMVNEKEFTTNGTGYVFMGGGLEFFTNDDKTIIASGGVSLFGFNRNGDNIISKRLSLRIGFVL